MCFRKYDWKLVVVKNIEFAVELVKKLSLKQAPRSKELKVNSQLQETY